MLVVAPAREADRRFSRWLRQPPEKIQGIVLVACVLVVCGVPSPSPLPHAEWAVIPAAKLRDYVLNPAHPQGGPKARVFAATLGFVRSDWRWLRDQLLAEVQTAPATPRGCTQWGMLYEVLVDIRGYHGRSARVRTGWICRLDDDRPHLTTAYVDLR